MLNCDIVKDTLRSGRATMFNFLVFLPENVIQWRGFVYGIVVKFTFGTAVYILGNECGNNCIATTAYQIVGHIGNRRKYSRQNGSEWISIIVNDGQITEVHVHNAPTSSVTSVILFNQQSIKKAELLSNVSSLECDYITRLVHEVKNRRVPCCTSPEVDDLADSTSTNAISRLIKCYLFFFNDPWMNNVVKISSFGLYVKNTFEVIDELLNNMIERKKFTVEFVNYAWARISDAVLGVVIIYLVTSYTSPNDIFNAVTRFQEYMVVTLENTVDWLMGSPAGFKLNGPLNNVLGPFYQFHIALWGTFLSRFDEIAAVICFKKCSV